MPEPQCLRRDGRKSSLRPRRINFSRILDIIKKQPQPNRPHWASFSSEWGFNLQSWHQSNSSQLGDARRMRVLFSAMRRFVSAARRLWSHPTGSSIAASHLDLQALSQRGKQFPVFFRDPARLSLVVIAPSCCCLSKLPLQDIPPHCCHPKDSPI